MRVRWLLWKFQYESVEVYVQLTGKTDDDLLTTHLTLLSLLKKLREEWN
jgi:hypothetical protein